jgi:hypothetical protein
VSPASRKRSKAFAWVAAILAMASAIAVSSPAGAQSAPPWDGNPISPGLGPTYGEPWCGEPPSGSIADQQDAPLALIPYEAIECTLGQFEDEAAANGVPDRLDYGVIGQSVLGRDILGVVVNALDTPEQQQAFARWQQLRSLMFDHPADAQTLLASWDPSPNVKLPIFIEANIHGNEEEGTDAMMQVIRDLVTLPRGANSTVDAVLDHAFVVVIPTTNPDGRVAGVRRNANGFDLNRDLFVQSQPEIQANVAFQQEWLAPVGLAMHGYYGPTLIDGLTKPHNPGIEYDLFVKWNQQRLDANEAAFTNAGMGIIRPVNDWNADGFFGRPPTGPAYAQGWDDWGPFYTQTYMAFYGVDGSTLEMCEDGAGCDGRFGSKRAQYIGFYSSADFWLHHRLDILLDQLEIFRRGLADEPRHNCCDDTLVAERGFTEAEHNWMVEYPTAYVIPFVGGSSSAAQRSDAEANRVAQWLLDNGLEVHRATAEFSWSGQTFPAGSYVVWMDQALRGIALTALSAGQDVSDRISQLYAPPGAWSHGLLWGADVVEIPRGDPTFGPATVPAAAVNPLQGGLRDGPADWYAVTLQGSTEVRAILDLLRDGIDGEVAEAAFTSASAAPMPAGSLIFDASAATELQAAGAAAGMFFERGVGAKPDTTQLREAPRVAILVDDQAPAENDTSWSLRQIFGQDVGFVSMVMGRQSLERSPTDPLEDFDVLYNLGQVYPPKQQPTARARLQAFFQRGGGYIGTSVSSANFSFLTNAVPNLIEGSLAQTNDSADGGIAVWTNEGIQGPLTGGFTTEDFLYLPANVTYFSSVPGDATIDGRYLSSTDDLFLAGLWRDRDAAVAGAPIIVHGTTTANSRYLGLATNPFSRGDAEREWALIGQAALWSNLTDET